jgi:hypothetical protein
MSKEGLKIIKDAMNALGINYSFMEWNGKPAYPYFVGEYQESPSLNEDGLQESTFLLTGFSRESWLALEDAKERIETYFSKVGGRTVIAESGSAVAVFYSNSLVIPTGDAELKKIQINLIVKEWKVN